MKIRDEIKTFKHWCVGALMSLDAAIMGAWQHIAVFQQYLSPTLLKDVAIGMLLLGLVVHYAPRKSP